MGVLTKVTGLTTTCTVTAYINGKMAAAMKDTMNMTKSKALGFIAGLMDEFTRATGLMGSSTVRASTGCLMGQ